MPRTLEYQQGAATTKRHHITRSILKSNHSHKANSSNNNNNNYNDHEKHLIPTKYHLY